MNFVDMEDYSQAIGLHEEIADTLNIVNFFGSKELAYNFEAMKEDAVARAADYHNESRKNRKNIPSLPTNLESNR